MVVVVVCVDYCNYFVVVDGVDDRSCVVGGVENYYFGVVVD